MKASKCVWNWTRRCVRAAVFVALWRGSAVTDGAVCVEEASRRRRPAVSRPRPAATCRRPALPRAPLFIVVLVRLTVSLDHLRLVAGLHANRSVYHLTHSAPRAGGVWRSSDSRAVFTNGHTGHVPRAPGFYFLFEGPPTGCGEITF